MFLHFFNLAFVRINLSQLLEANIAWGTQFGIFSVPVLQLLLVYVVLALDEHVFFGALKKAFTQVHFQDLRLGSLRGRAKGFAELRCTRNERQMIDGPLREWQKNKFERPRYARYGVLLSLYPTYTDFSNLIEANTVGDTQYGILIVLAISSLSVYGLILSGWSSNSKYAFLGALRSAAQMISYEVSISLVMLPLIAVAGTLNFARIVFSQLLTSWFGAPMLQPSGVFFVSMIAETNRTPFDLPEAEAELVAGYNIEYSSIIFAMFFLAEYGNMSMMSLLKSMLFLGGGGNEAVVVPVPQASVITTKGLIFCFLFVLVRASFPRYRYDQLMDIGWKIFLPISTGFFMYFVGNLVAFKAAPIIQELAPLDYCE